jgi:predicted phage terminase large subunit-like protein
LPVAIETSTARPPVQIRSAAEYDAELCRRHHLDFMRQVWQKPEPFVEGRHAVAICGRIDRAIADYRAGLSTFLIISVPIRHGKSDLLPRHLPAKFIAEFPDAEVMLVTYSAELADDLSRFARKIIQSTQYRRLYPSIRLAQDSAAVSRWGIAGHTGGMVAAGFGGSITGRGFSLGLIDDFCKNREEAESTTIRNKTWESFKNDFMTRRAPVSITIIGASPWNVDDLIGRIKKSMKDDPTFPRFETIRFPAFDDGSQNPPYPQGILFPERYGRAWYDGQRSTLGTYGTAGLLQCDPKPRTGNLLKTDMAKIEEAAPEGLRWVRSWDLASTEKELSKSDPDWSAGVLEAVEYRTLGGVPIPHLWIKDVVRGQWEAPERDRRIKQVAMMDGPGVRVGTESVAGYKDTYTRLKEVLAGIRTVEAIVPAGDKLIRVSPLEPIFEAGNVHLIRGDWNQAFLDECADFPAGAHDDQVDGMSGGWSMCARRRVPHVAYVGAA